MANWDRNDEYGNRGMGGHRDGGFFDRAGICQTDVHLVHGKTTYAPYPVILGHEILGRVAALGPEAARRWGADAGSSTSLAHESEPRRRRHRRPRLVDEQEGRQAGLGHVGELADRAGELHPRLVVRRQRRVRPIRQVRHGGDLQGGARVGRRTRAARDGAAAEQDDLERRERDVETQV